MLTKNWNLFSSQSIETFTQEYYHNASKILHTLPKNASVSIERMIQYNILNKYHTLEDLEISFEKLQHRLSPRLQIRDPATQYMQNCF